MTKYRVFIGDKEIVTVCHDPVGALATVLDAIPYATRAWWSSAKEITVETGASNLILAVKARRMR